MVQTFAVLRVATIFLLRATVTHSIITSNDAREHTVNRFNRTDVLRILHITPRQLSGWERAGLIAVGDTFTFADLLQLKKVRDLRAQKVRPATIRESLQAMQRQVNGMENPLLEAGTFSMGTRVAFRHKGKTVDPIDGQFLMDFAETGTVIEAKAPRPTRVKQPSRPAGPVREGVQRRESSRKGVRK